MVTNVIPRRSTRSTSSRNKSYNVEELTKASSKLNKDPIDKVTAVEDAVENDNDGEERTSEAEDEEEENSDADDEDEDPVVEEEDIDDEEYFEGRRKRTKNGNSSGGKRRKKGKHLLSNRAEEIEDFEENELYKALTNPEASVQDIVLEWLELYKEEEENDGLAAITSLVNMILRCCGCLYLLQPHDLANLESASETIAELNTSFKAQRSHEFPFISNNKDVKFFRSNVLEFFQKLCAICHTKGLLYNDVALTEKSESLTSPFMNQLLTWLLTLSTSPVRPLRLVSTSVLMTIQTALCSIMSDIADLLEKNQRKLDSTTGSRRKLKANMESLVSIVNNLNHQKNTISEYFSDIVDVALSHRYRDVDPAIRQECVSELSKWLVTFPEEFFQNSYFRYFGWLLSDPNPSVRSEVSKSLGRVLKFCITNSSSNGPFIRQFAERFKVQISNMCYSDQDVHVRIGLISVLDDFVKLEFLSHEEKIDISLHFLQMTQSKFGFSKANELRLKNEYAKFIHTVHVKYLEDTKAEHSDMLRELGSATSFDIDQMWKFKSLINLLEEAYSHREETIESYNKFDAASLIFKSLYNLPFYHQSWLFILKLYTFDVSSIELNSEEVDTENVQLMLDVSLDDDKAYILSFILGALRHISTKKRYDTDDIDNPENVVQKVMGDLRIVLADLLKSKEQSPIFLLIWTLLLSSFNQNNKVYSTFLNSNDGDLYHKVTIELFKYFAEVTEPIDSSPLISKFEAFFESLFEDGPFAIPSEIRNYVDVMISNIVDELIESMLKDDHLDLVEDKLLPLSNNVVKLNTIGNFVNLKSSSADFTAVFNREILEKFDLMKWAKQCTKDYTNKSDLAKLFKIFFDLVLILNASTLEEMLASQDGHANIDILQAFKSTFTTIESLVSKMDNFLEVSAFLNEQLGTSSTNISLNEGKDLLNTVFTLQTVFTVAFIDLVVSMKLFYIKYKDTNSFINFYEFFDDVKVRDLLRFNLPMNVQTSILNLFLVKENQLASQLGVELERGIEEDVNYGVQEVDSEAVAIESPISVPVNGEEQLISEARAENLKQQQNWKAEQELCVFTVKVFGLINLGLMNDDIPQRLKLNSKRLGGLFLKVVDQYVKDSTSLSTLES